MIFSRAIIIFTCFALCFCEEELHAPDLAPRGVIIVLPDSPYKNKIIDIQSDGHGFWCAFYAVDIISPDNGPWSYNVARVDSSGSMIHRGSRAHYFSPAYSLGTNRDIFMTSRNAVSDSALIERLDSNYHTFAQWNLRSIANVTHAWDIQFIEPGVIGYLASNLVNSSLGYYLTTDELGSVLNISPLIPHNIAPYSSRAFNALECLVTESGRPPYIRKLNIRDKSVRVMQVPFHGDSAMGAKALSVCKDGAFYVLGKSYVCKMDTTGGERWFYQNHDAVFNSIRTTPDGGCIIGGGRRGRTSAPHYGKPEHVSGLVTRFSPSGALMWTWELPCDMGIDVAAVEYLETDEILVGGEAGCWLQRGELTYGAWIAKLRARDGSIVESFGAR